MRSSNIELLRLLAMFLIVSSHYTVHGINMGALSNPNLTHYNILPLGGGIGVNCFVLASGFFMVKSSISISRITKIIYHVISYAALLSAISYFIGAPYFDTNWKQVIKTGLGIMGEYWFTNTYISLMLIVPFLNHFLLKASKKLHIHCILTLVALNYVCPIYFHINTYFGALGQFISLYVIAAYIRFYGMQNYSCKKLWITLSIVTLGTVTWLYLVNIFYTYLNCEYLYWVLYNCVVCRESIPVLIISVLTFAAFLNCNIKHSRLINFTASCTLGIYLFHEHPLMRDFLWQKLLITAEAPFGNCPVLHCCGAIIGIYVAGTIVDIIWQQTVGRLYAPTERFIIMPIYSQMKKWGKGIIQRIIELDPAP